MHEITQELAALVGKAKAARLMSERVTAPDTLPAYDLAHTLAQIGTEFVNLAVKAVKLKQAGRKAADEAAAERTKWTPPKLNAKRAADAIVKAGGYRVPV